MVDAYTTRPAIPCGSTRASTALSHEDAATKRGSKFLIGTGVPSTHPRATFAAPLPYGTTATRLPRLTGFGCAGFVVARPDLASTAIFEPSFWNPLGMSGTGGPSAPVASSASAT